MDYFADKNNDEENRDSQVHFTIGKESYSPISTSCSEDERSIDESEAEDRKVLVGVCAMSKKSRSKPMLEILERLGRFSHIETLVFDEKVILHEPIHSWPLVDCLISFHSKGFPLEKAIQYTELRKPLVINDLTYQYQLQDRSKVYKILNEHGIEKPRYVMLNRGPTGNEECDFIETDDSIEVNGITFTKPFVEKPLSAEDHNVYIYFPSSAGGGSQRLFRKIGCRSSVYSPVSTVRKIGSYMYEDFMPTDGTDVKVYTVGPDYAHAEARKSPALDGKVERDKDGKEIRYPVLLNAKEKLIARTVSLAFKQNVCGFDLLRANGKSYVCDVNGFSFVKTSPKYYDDCAKILGNLILRTLAPTLHLPYSVTFQAEDIPIVPTTFGTMMELRTVLAVMRHGDRTPKQKMKMEVKHKMFFDLFEKFGGFEAGQLKLKRPKQLQQVLDIARAILQEAYLPDPDPEVVEKYSKFEQLKSVLEMHGHFSGINRKVQFKYQAKNCDEINSPKEHSLVLILKWGGELTPAGKIQAEELGKAFRCMYPGGQGEFGSSPGLGLLRLHSTYRHNLKIYASDEGRVQMTAAAFAKGFLALEGELTPILVQMVKSANMNGLLDNENEPSKQQTLAKDKLQQMLNIDRVFTEEDILKFVPTHSISISQGLRNIGNPRATCMRIHQIIQKLMVRLQELVADPKTAELKLYHGESWELMTRRWAKLVKDFQISLDKQSNKKSSDHNILDTNLLTPKSNIISPLNKSNLEQSFFGILNNRKDENILNINKDKILHNTEICSKSTVGAQDISSKNSDNIQVSENKYSINLSPTITDSIKINDDLENIKYSDTIDMSDNLTKLTSISSNDIANTIIYPSSIKSKYDAEINDLNIPIIGNTASKDTQLNFINNTPNYTNSLGEHTIKTISNHVLITDLKNTSATTNDTSDNIIVGFDNPKSLNNNLVNNLGIQTDISNPNESLNNKNNIANLNLSSTNHFNYDVSKIPDIYDCIKYDLQHNAKTLRFSEAEELHVLAKAMADVVIPQEYGITMDEKLSISESICLPLLRKILADFQQNADDGDEPTRLDSRYSEGVTSPHRHVKSRFYFTSESHIHSLLTILRYGGLCNSNIDEQWQRAMDYISSISELNYLSQIVIMLYEDPTKSPDSVDRFHMELHFSPGAYTVGQDRQQNTGRGYRPQHKENNKNIGKTKVREIATSPGMLNDYDSIPKVYMPFIQNFPGFCKNLSQYQYLPPVLEASKEKMPKSNANSDSSIASTSLSDESPKKLSLITLNNKLIPSIPKNNDTIIANRDVVNSIIRDNIHNTLNSNNEEITNKNNDKSLKHDIIQDVTLIKSKKTDKIEAFEEILNTEDIISVIPIKELKKRDKISVTPLNEVEVKDKIQIQPYKSKKYDVVNSKYDVMVTDSQYEGICEEYASDEHEYEYDPNMTITEGMGLKIKKRYYKPNGASQNKILRYKTESEKSQEYEENTSSEKLKRWRHQSSGSVEKDITKDNECFKKPSNSENNQDLVQSSSISIINQKEIRSRSLETLQKKNSPKDHHGHHHHHRDHNYKYKRNSIYAILQNQAIEKMEAWRVPSLNPLETLHNSLTLHQFELFIDKIIQMSTKSPVVSPASSIYMP